MDGPDIQTGYIMRVFKFLATALLAAGFGAAHGATVTITFDNPIFGETGHDTGKIYFPSTPESSNTRNMTVHAGRFVGEATNLVGIAPENFVDSTDSVFMYCYDLYDYIGAGDRVDYTIDFSGAVDRTLQFLFAVNTVLDASDPYAWARPTNQWQAAAVQIGIWESLYDSGWSLDDGSFKIQGFDDETRQWASLFFSELDENQLLDQRFTMVLRADGKQDMITADPPTQIPEPGSLALLATGLLGLAILRRRQG